jgi:hypothetical protein
MAEEKDKLVQEAISHWAPRFTTNGVAVFDFNTVTNSVSKWSDWADAWAKSSGCLLPLWQICLYRLSRKNERKSYEGS